MDNTEQNLEIKGTLKLFECSRKMMSETAEELEEQCLTIICKNSHEEPTCVR